MRALSQQGGILIIPGDDHMTCVYQGSVANTDWDWKTLHHIIKTLTSTRMTTVVTSVKVVQNREILSDMVRNPLR